MTIERSIMNDKDWLNNLKAGDQVIVSGRWHKDIHKVKKVTPTGIVVVETYNGGEERFKNGREMRKSGIWDFHDELKEATPKAVQAIKNSEMIDDAKHRLEKTQSSLTVDQWRRIKTILDEAEAKPNE
jgi:preprotein translocase subunit YajC